MDVSHLRPTGAEHFAGRLLLAFDEPGVGRKLLDPTEARDVVNLVEDRQGQDLPNARHRSQAVESVGIVAFGLADNRELKVGDEGVVLGHQRQIDVDALAHAGIGEVLPHAVAIGRIAIRRPKAGRL